MKVMAFNGSPRKEWNTATLLQSALEGAASRGAQVELVHLYDLDYKGCTSCFACKRAGGKSYGRCAMQDGLTPFLKEIESVDGIILGSPVYLGSATGQMRSLLERLVFPFFTYTDPPASLFPGKLRVGMVYTFGATEEMVLQRGWDRSLAEPGAFLQRTFGPVETLMAFDTLQFDDYSKYVAPRFDPAHKAARRREVFPQDCRKAFELGARLVSEGQV
ncbi:MAG: flavodoxin family protein [Candidatus Omnitrophica bacterium]|nr:flavodoxin family protein [Candidatus Omnitrophota bacterium]